MVLLVSELVVVLVVAGRVGPEPGSGWSARSGARTNDLDAGEDRRTLRKEDGSLGLPFGGWTRCAGRLQIPGGCEGQARPSSAAWTCLRRAPGGAGME